MNAERCRRRPFTSTSVWSGDSPLSRAGRTKARPSPIVSRCTLNEGTAWVSASVNSEDAELRITAAGTTSIGASDSVAERPIWRVPVTTTEASRSGSAGGTAPESSGVTKSATGSREERTGNETGAERDIFG